MSGTDAGNYTLSNTTATTTATILKATSTTSVASSADPSNAGATVTFTATISPQLGGTPTGSVSFYDGATLLGSGGLTGGQASYQTSTLSVGTHSITAVYGGDGNFNGSDDTQTPLTQTVNQTSTTTALTSSSAGDTSTYGDSVTLTASVVLQGTTTAVTGGSVTFIEGGTCSAPSQSLTGPVALNSNGQALLTTSTLAAGSDTITACYGGTATLNPSSANVTQTVNKKILTVSGVTATNKVYDGTTSATLNTSGATLVGVVSGDSVTLGTAGATGSFANKSVGNGKIVTVSGLSISGSSATNYTLNQPSAVADISPRSLTVSGITAGDKVYDGTTSATLNLSAASLNGVLAGDSVTLSTSAATGSFADKIVVTAYGVTYDAKAHTATGSATGVKGEALSGLDLSGTTHTNAGSYTNDSWSFTDATGNYNNASGTVKDSIGQATPKVVVTGGSFTYDGTPHAATATGVGGALVSGSFGFTYLLQGTSGTLSATAPTNAGTYDVSASFTSTDGNYTNNTGSGSITITKASASASPTTPTPLP